LRVVSIVAAQSAAAPNELGSGLWLSSAGDDADDMSARPCPVVIVDPDADTRALYRTALHASGFDTDEAEDGREALAKAFADRPLAVVVETRLPFVDGYDLCRILAHDAFTAGVPVIVVSGDAEDSQVERARNAGADAVLTKPCLPETLIAEIRRVLDARCDASRASPAQPNTTPA
jgi:DNA-binding response OmpR family regulator